MAAVRPRHNRAEVALRKALWRRGLRYRLYDRRLPGRPDLVFPAFRSVVFVDGDFWHGRILVERGPRALRRSFRSQRADFWVMKIKRNAQRDREQTAALGALGWQVIRVWETDVLKDLTGVAARIARVIRRSHARSHRN